MQKAINAEAKASFLPLFMLKEIDQYIARNKQPAKSIKGSVSKQKTSIKNQKAKKPRP